MISEVFWFVLAAYYLAFLYFASILKNIALSIGSKSRLKWNSIIRLFTNIWQAVLGEPLASLLFPTHDAGSLTDLAEREAEESTQSLMKPAQSDQEGKAVQTANRAENTELQPVNSPNMQIILIDMEPLKSVVITLQALLQSALERLNGFSYLMESQIIVQGHRAELHRCSYQARLQLTENYLDHLQKRRSLSMSFQCKCEFSSQIYYNIGELRKLIAHHRNGGVARVGPVRDERVSFTLNYSYSLRSSAQVA